MRPEISSALRHYKAQAQKSENAANETLGYGVVEQTVLFLVTFSAIGLRGRSAALELASHFCD